MFLSLINKKSLFLLVLLALLGAQACSSKIYKLDSLPPQHEIIVDGNSEEWRGVLYFLEDKGTFLGCLNDKDSLYLCLVLSEGPSSAMMMMRGLTVWLDPTGGTKKTFGIKYPAEMDPRDMMERGMMDRPSRPPEIMPEDMPNELEILFAGTTPPEKLTLEQAKEKGLEVKVSLSRGTSVYELKIPLVSSDSRPFALGAGPGAVIGIGIESNSFNPMGFGPRGGMGGGMGRPPGGGMPGGMGGGRGGIMPGMPSPIKIWAQVQLASSENAVPSRVLSVVSSR